MMNEFKDLNLLCEGASIVPSGSGYSTSVSANQVCTLAGAKAGEQYVAGSAYIKAGKFSILHISLSPSPLVLMLP